MTTKEVYENLLNSDKKHPEQGKDEILLGNEHPSNLAGIGWKTKRVGRLPLDADGKPMPKNPVRPIFIKRSEIEQAIKDLDEK